ncbi:MAG: glycoside hydrolase family 27 protein [Ferruginibacter sp.]
MKYCKGFLFLFLIIAKTAATQVAQTPPMGWNSYNSYGSAVHENEVKANADYMAKNLKQYGWQYIVVDFCWSYPNPPGSNVGNPFQSRLPDGAYIPWLNMDEYGRLLPDEKKFPSARDGRGFKPLADYVHGLGLKFGIHIMRGIPRQAAWAKSKVLGTNTDASAVADTNSICRWLNHMFGVNLQQAGAQEYYNSIVNLYASWGVDYIKMDDASGMRTVYQSEVEAVHKAIQQCGRPMVLSLSPGQPFKDHEYMQKNANAYRISFDFWDNWKQLKKQFDNCREWSVVTAPGNWPDADMLQIGKVSKRGPEGPERSSRFTEDEQITHISLWSIFRSPLMIGGNMPENTPFVKGLLTNAEVLSVNQNSTNSHELYRTDSTVIVWVSQVNNSKDWNVALFNLDSTVHEIKIDFSAIGIAQKCMVRDLWRKQDAGVFNNQFGQKVNPHGAVMLKLSPVVNK